MSTSKKFDSGKPRFSLIPPRALLHIMSVLEYGAKKYGVNNWQGLDNHEDRFLDAMQRHYLAHRQGQKIDPESGLPHLAHMITSLLFELHYVPLEAGEVTPDEQKENPAKSS